MPCRCWRDIDRRASHAISAEFDDADSAITGAVLILIIIAALTLIALRHIVDADTLPILDNIIYVITRCRLHSDVSVMSYDERQAIATPLPMSITRGVLSAPHYILLTLLMAILTCCWLALHIRRYCHTSRRFVTLAYAVMSLCATHGYIDFIIVDIV